MSLLTQHCSGANAFHDALSERAHDISASLLEKASLARSHANGLNLFAVALQNRVALLTARAEEAGTAEVAFLDTLNAQDPADTDEVRAGKTEASLLAWAKLQTALEDWRVASRGVAELVT